MAKAINELTPMQRQYNQIKEANQDCILFFRLGDFYEMFNEDAKVAARELDLTLTTRDRGKPKEEQTPMCGVPYHSVDSYIARLVRFAGCDSLIGTYQHIKINGATTWSLTGEMQNAECKMQN